MSDVYSLYIGLNKYHSLEMIQMNTSILEYVEKMQATLLIDMVTANELDLYDIANDMIAKSDDKDFEHICQAYEIVKHHLVG